MSTSLDISATLTTMTTKYARVNLALEPALYDALGWLASYEGVSLSTKAHDLLLDALERHEDLVLAEVAAERERTLG
jgi:hypothetical protein